MSRKLIDNGPLALKNGQLHDLHELPSYVSKLLAARIWQMNLHSETFQTFLHNSKPWADTSRQWVVNWLIMAHRLSKWTTTRRNSDDFSCGCLHWGENMADETPFRIFVKRFCTTQSSWLSSMPHYDTFLCIGRTDFFTLDPQPMLTGSVFGPRAIVSHPL